MEAFSENKAIWKWKSKNDSRYGRNRGKRAGSKNKARIIAGKKESRGGGRMKIRFKNTIFFIKIRKLCAM